MLIKNLQQNGIVELKRLNNILFFIKIALTRRVKSGQCFILSAVGIQIPNKSINPRSGYWMMWILICIWILEYSGDLNTRHSNYRLKCYHLNNGQFVQYSNGDLNRMSSIQMNLDLGCLVFGSPLYCKATNANDWILEWGVRSDLCINKFPTLPKFLFCTGYWRGRYAAGLTSWNFIFYFLPL